MTNFKELKQKISSSKSAQTKIFFILFIIIFISGVLYWLHTRHNINTDNAYVNANIIRIAPQISGKVAQINIKNNQLVKSGDLLFELDSTPFQIARDKANAQLSIAEAAWKNAQASTLRISTLAKNKVSSAQEHDNSIKDLQIATAAVELNKASLAQAELDLHNTKIFAPTDGYISNMTLSVGNMVNAFQPIFALISTEQYWIDANFKETELKNIKPGQTAKIIIDMYPSYIFKGIVDSISSGSGSVFSLLPPQNASGNWVKITQRVSIKIYILNPTPQYPLRIGTTATVSIDTSNDTINTQPDEHQ